MHLHPFAALAVLVAAALPATAEVLPVVDLDLRVGYALREGAVDITSGGITADDDWDRAGRFFGQAVLAPVPGPASWLIGGRVIADNAKITSGGSDAEYDTVAIHAQVGLGITPLPLLRVELLPYVGVGSARYEAGAISSNDVIYEAGVDLNGVVTFPSGIQIGAGAGWLWSTSEHDVGATTIDIEQSGLIGTVFVGYRL